MPKAAQDIDDYLQAATRHNTRLSYRSAIEHFENHWGGYLPTTADSVSRYLADHASTLSQSTLRVRLAALARWHQDQGFPDPTKAPLVKRVLKGIGELHPQPVRQAKPLQIEQLHQVVCWIDQEIDRRETQGASCLSLWRNKALLLIGFWRGFRADELCRMDVENIDVEPSRGMLIHLARSKTSQGRSYRTPALTQLCPVTAYQAWIEAAGLAGQTGPVFRAVNRWGKLSDTALHPASVIPILRTLLADAGVSLPEGYSSHSLRRGFASWASANQWDVKSLMAYVGWKDVQSAMRYIETPDPYSQSRIEQGLASLPAPSRVLEVTLSLQRYHKGVRSARKVLGDIERFCLKPLGMAALKAGHYRIEVPDEPADRLDARVDELLGEMYHLARDGDCVLEASIHDPATRRVWE